MVKVVRILILLGVMGMTRGGGAVQSSPTNDGIYYVAPLYDGNIGRGTKSEPFHSLSSAFAALGTSKLPSGVSGFTLYMYPGEYTGLENTNVIVSFSLMLAPLFDNPKVVLRGSGGLPLLTIISPSASQKCVVKLRGITFIGGSTTNDSEKYGGALRVNFNALS